MQKQNLSVIALWMCKQMADGEHFDYNALTKSRNDPQIFFKSQVIVIGEILKDIHFFITFFKILGRLISVK